MVGTVEASVEDDVIEFDDVSDAMKQTGANSILRPAKGADRTAVDREGRMPTPRGVGIQIRDDLTPSRVCSTPPRPMEPVQ